MKTQIRYRLGFKVKPKCNEKIETYDETQNELEATK